MKTTFKYLSFLLFIIFPLSCCKDNTDIIPLKGIVSFTVDEQKYQFSKLLLSGVTDRGFMLRADTLDNSTTSFFIAINHYTTLDKLKVGEKFPLTYASTYSSSVSIYTTPYYLWHSINDYWTNELAGEIEVIGWDGKTMEAKIDFWGTNTWKWNSPEKLKYREKHITGHLKVKVR